MPKDCYSLGETNVTKSKAEFAKQGYHSGVAGNMALCYWPRMC